MKTPAITTTTTDAVLSFLFLFHKLLFHVIFDYPSEQTAEMLMTLSSPELSRNMTAEEQAMIFAQIMFPTEWLEEHPGFLNTFIETAPLSSVSPEIIQQQTLASATWAAQ